MNRNTPFLTACILVLLVGTPHGAALHCNGTIITLEAGDEALYVDHRSDKPGSIEHRVWLYLESNGVEGLQSGIEIVCADWCWYEPCMHADPDTLIF